MSVINYTVLTRNGRQYTKSYGNIKDALIAAASDFESGDQPLRILNGMSSYDRTQILELATRYGYLRRHRRF